MKKMLVLIAVLSISSVAAGHKVWFQVAADDVKESYEPSDVITIEMISDAEVLSLLVDCIHSDKGGTAMKPIYLDPRLLDCSNPPIIINDFCLIWYVCGTVPLGMPGVPAGEPILSFDFHVPELPYSTYITIDDYKDPQASPPIATYFLFGDWTEGSDVSPLVIHVVSGCPPCQTCLGDLNGDCWITVADLGRIMAILGPTKDWPFPYKVPCTDPSYNPCADMDGNEWITVADYGKVLAIIGPTENDPIPFKVPCEEPCTPQ